jgi:hypothetical protein
MTDEYDLLIFIHSPMSFDGNGKKLHQRICGVCIPSFGLKGGESTSREVNGEAWREVRKAKQNGVELGHRATKPVNKDQ